MQNTSVRFIKAKGIEIDKNEESFTLKKESSANSKEARIVSKFKRSNQIIIYSQQVENIIALQFN